MFNNTKKNKSYFEKIIRVSGNPFYKVGPKNDNNGIAKNTYGIETNIDEFEKKSAIINKIKKEINNFDSKTTIIFFK